TNDLYLSPGLGYPGGGTGGTGNGSIRAANSTYTGTVILRGSPGSTAGSGNRIDNQNNNGNLTIAGRITGTGALEYFAGAATVSLFLSNVTANANNWTGGLIIDGANNDNSIVKLGANNQIVSNTVYVIQGGTGSSRLDLNGFSDTMGGLSATS